jgi:apolipoprotein N-acyltransferase
MCALLATSPAAQELRHSRGDGVTGRRGTDLSFVGAFAAGLLLFLSDQPLHWWPLQFVALLPWWAALANRRQSGRHLWPLGPCLAGGFAVPLLGAVGTAPPILAAAVAGAVEWTLAAMLCGRLLGRGPLRSAFAAAAALTLLEIAMWSWVPLFGTAQCFARPLSAAPLVVAFVAFTGVGGIVFALAAIQALIVQAMLNRRSGPAWVAAGIVIVFAGLDLVRWYRPLGPTLRVAAYAWGTEAPPGGASLMWLDAAMTDARSAGAVLLVTPETGFGIGSDRELAVEKLSARVRKHGLATALGVWHNPTRDNRIWFFDSEGRLSAEYRKTHLVPWLEDYRAGDGGLALTSIGGVAVGGMICQDDNFTDLARGYGGHATQLLAVPTNDWPAIREVHLDNALFRSIENGYAVVRAASNGISALVSPRGEVLARCDHVVAGPQLLLGDVPVGDGNVTLYARCGDWPMLAVCTALVALAFVQKRR